MTSGGVHLDTGGVQVVAHKAERGGVGGAHGQEPLRAFNPALEARIAVADQPPVARQQPLPGPRRERDLGQMHGHRAGRDGRILVPPPRLHDTGT